MLGFQDLGVFVFEFWVLRFRDLGASFSSFGCFVFKIWVLRASVFVFECFVFKTTFEFVVGSLPRSQRFFSGYSGFPLSSKTDTSKFQFDLKHTNTFKRVHMNS